MVAAQSRDGTGVNGFPQVERSKDATRIKWAPRSGRSKGFKLWMYDLLDRIGDIGYESFEEVLRLEPPAKDALTQNAGDGVERRATRATNADELYTQALEEFQTINGQIHNIVYPSLIFTGPHEEADLETARKYRKGALKNGIGLLKWALQWTVTDTYEVQSFLREELNKAKIAPSANCLTLYQFLMKLLEVWSTISNNDVSDPASLNEFYTVLQQKLPVKVDGGHLALVRQWLVNKKIEKNMILSNPKTAITTMVLYAKEQGMPSGGYGDELKHGFEDVENTSMMAIGGDGGPGDRGGYRGGRDRHDQDLNKPKYGPETCECSDCDSFYCFPKNRNSACGKCICDPQSEFDVKKEEYGIAAGGRRYVYVSRAWNKLNPSKKLKGVNFKAVQEAVMEHDDKSGGIVPSVDKKKVNFSTAPQVNNIGTEDGATAVQSIMSLSDVFAAGHGNDDPDAFQEWLDRLNDGPSLQMAGAGDDLMDQLDESEADRVLQQGGRKHAAPQEGGQASAAPESEKWRGMHELMRSQSLELAELKAHLQSMEKKKEIEGELEARRLSSVGGMTPDAIRQNELALQTPPTNPARQTTAREQYDSVVKPVSESISTIRGGSRTIKHDDSSEKSRKSSAEYAGMAIVESEREKRIQADKKRKLERGGMLYNLIKYALRMAHATGRNMLDYLVDTFSIPALLSIGGTLYFFYRIGAAELIKKLVVKIAYSTVGALMVAMRDRLRARIPDWLYQFMELVAGACRKLPRLKLQMSADSTLPTVPPTRGDDSPPPVLAAVQPSPPATRVAPSLSNAKEPECETHNRSLIQSNRRISPIREESPSVVPIMDSRGSIVPIMDSRRTKDSTTKKVTSEFQRPDNQGEGPILMNITTCIDADLNEMLSNENINPNLMLINPKEADPDHIPRGEINARQDNEGSILMNITTGIDADLNEMLSNENINPNPMLIEPEEADHDHRLIPRRLIPKRPG